MGERLDDGHLGPEGVPEVRELDPDGSRADVALISGQRRALETGYAPRLQPLLVNSFGRTGTTLLMRMLAAHPAVVTYARPPPANGTPPPIGMAGAATAGIRIEVPLRARAERVGASDRVMPATIALADRVVVMYLGKVVELAVKAVVHGMPVPNTDALANPEALDLYRNLPELTT